MFGKNKSAPIPTDPIGSLSAVGRTTAREAKVFAADVEQTSIIAANFATRVEDFAAQLIALCDALDALDAIVKRD